MLRLLEAAFGSRPARIVVFGPQAAAWLTAGAAAGHEVRIGALVADEPALEDGSRPAPGSVDVVIAIDWLEHVRWDRWCLQRIHGWLPRHGLLVLTAPNLLSPRSLADPRYVGRKLGKQWRKIERLLGRATIVPPGRPEIRSYAAARLVDMVENLGFDIDRAASQVATFGSRHLIIARRRPSVFGLDPERPFPEATAFMAGFERRNAASIAVRDAWLGAREREGAVREVRELDPAAFAGAAILVLAPHPDDELIGCGGTLHRLADAGARITILQATDGSASAAFIDEPEEVRRRVRLEEAERVARSIGVARTIWWREDNRRFDYRPELVTRLRDAMAETRPSVVFVPFVTDIHPDHVLLARILSAALDGGHAPEIVLGYEIWCRVPANAWCDVGDVMRQLEQELHLYTTAMKVDDFVHACAERNYANALELTGRPGFVEAFHATDARGYRAIVAPPRAGA